MPMLCGMASSPRTGPPAVEPIGVQLARTAKVLNRAFEDALAEVGGSLPVWLILVSLKGAQHETQRALADALGIEGPTLTHHLTKMEAGGLVTRRRDPENRRVQVVELTAAGDATFFRLLATVTAFDARGPRRVQRPRRRVARAAPRPAAHQRRDRSEGGICMTDVPDDPRRRRSGSARTTPRSSPGRR